MLNTKVVGEPRVTGEKKSSGKGSGAYSAP